MKNEGTVINAAELHTNKLVESPNKKTRCAEPQIHTAPFFIEDTGFFITRSTLEVNKQVCVAQRSNITMYDVSKAHCGVAS